MGKRVLIVDDSPFMRLLVKNVLVPNGFEVCGEAGDGSQAVEQYRALKPDFVTMDLAMPKMDGLAALKAIRAQDAGAKIFMVTSAGQHSIMMEAAQAGSAGFIQKPFQADKMLQTIRQALGVSS